MAAASFVVTGNNSRWLVLRGGQSVETYRVDNLGPGDLLIKWTRQDVEELNQLTGLTTIAAGGSLHVAAKSIAVQVANAGGGGLEVVAGSFERV